MSTWPCEVSTFSDVSVLSFQVHAFIVLILMYTTTKTRPKQWRTSSSSKALGPDRLRSPAAASAWTIYSFSIRAVFAFDKARHGTNYYSSSLDAFVRSLVLEAKITPVNHATCDMETDKLLE